MALSPLCLVVPSHGDTAQLEGGREGEREIPTEPSTAQALGQAEVCVQQELVFIFYLFLFFMLGLVFEKCTDLTGA